MVMPDPYNYQWLLATPTQKQWEHTGISRRAGVAVPLFSLYTQQSIGIGEYPDLKLFADWCRRAGLTIIQLLPLNDMGMDFTPYAAQSTLALDPMFINLYQLRGCPLDSFYPRMEALRQAFPPGQARVNYTIKAEKLALLWDVFRAFKQSPRKSGREFEAFCTTHAAWLEDYALYKRIKAQYQQTAWFHWPEELRLRDAAALNEFKTNQAESIDFEQWLQWQAYEQLRESKKYAESLGVWFMGDLPFLVSYDSADVWANQGYFKLDQVAGAPPDLYFARGQRWGMPPYNWEAIAANHYDYLIRKLVYAENFYTLYRIDHFVGLLRIWSIPITEPYESAGLHGRFDPSDEAQWENHGQQLLKIMIAATRMLPCAEDLGTVPDCSNRVIQTHGIVGMDIQRWVRIWNGNFSFKPPEDYRPNSIAAIASHDMNGLKAWWEDEVGTVDELFFRSKCAGHGLDADRLISVFFNRAESSPGRLRWHPTWGDENKVLSVLERPSHEVQDIMDLYHGTYDEREKFLAYLGWEAEHENRYSPTLAQKVLEKINQSASIFSIQLLTDWLLATPMASKLEEKNLRINTPGTVGDNNWTLVMPFAVEELLSDASGAEKIYQLNRQSHRC